MRKKTFTPLETPSAPAGGRYKNIKGADDWLSGSGFRSTVRNPESKEATAACPEYPRRVRRWSFTIIELINVILIIGILSVIALAKFLDFRDAARAARDQGTLSALRSALYIYYSNSALSGTPHYPPDLDTLKGLVHWDPPELADMYIWEYNNTTGNITP
ncbi:MAG: type II secretion system protein [Candidatus Omnitrophota bacterium]